jgi:hypothetical protein
MCCPECARIGAASFEGGSITEQADVAHATEHGQCVCVEGSFERAKNFVLTDKNDCLRIDGDVASIDAKGGDDAIVVKGDYAGIMARGGNDAIVVDGKKNNIDAGDGDDTLIVEHGESNTDNTLIGGRGRRLTSRSPRTGA